jgi:macrolide transport system ATP-binding/permease protein
MSKIAGLSHFYEITVRIKSNINPEIAKTSLKKILTDRYPGKIFTVRDSEDFLEKISEITSSLQILFFSIAAISLAVGGIGIMNIMLVSVTERTHEIGIRMAVGASQKDILQQFLIEAALVCFVGGMIGVLFAFCISIALKGTFNMIISMSSILLACGFSMGVGLVFGFLPARKASKLDPAVALANG